MQGKIVRQISNQYTVEIDNQQIVCSARGKFRNDKLTPLVGDIVQVDVNNQVIMKIMPRKNELHRPTIANVDIAIIVTSLVEPTINYSLLDKFITLIEYNNIEPVILLTKLDLTNVRESLAVSDAMKYYESIGYKVFNNNDLIDIINYLDHKTVVLTGQTGAGKSSFLNKIDPTFNIETGEISQALGRGKHTTRHTQLYKFDNILIADTPGFGSLELKDMTPQNIKDSFVEFRKYECKFRDCKHINETHCGVKSAVETGEILLSRYNNYLSFVGGNNED